MLHYVHQLDAYFVCMLFKAKQVENRGFNRAFEALTREPQNSELKDGLTLRSTRELQSGDNWSVSQEVGSIMSEFSFLCLPTLV